MEERLTNSVPEGVQQVTEVPSDPGALFGPISPAMKEPAMTAASVPPSIQSPTDTAPRHRGWPKYVAIGAIALLVGAGAGWFAGAPQRSDLTTQRDDALTQVDTLTAQLDDSESQLASTQTMLDEANAGLSATKADLQDAQSELATMTEARDGATARADSCESAATTADDLVVQWANIFGDLNTYWESAYGSAAEAQILLHIDEQFQKMDEQQVALDRAMETCLG